MVFEPVKPEIKEKVIEYHLAGYGRNKIDRLMNQQEKKVSHSSISNIIVRYKREHEHEQQQQQLSLQKQQQVASSSSSLSIGEEPVDTNINNDQEVDFDDQAYETVSDALLAGEYNPALDGVDWERLLGFEQGVDIPDAQNYNHVSKEIAQIKEPSAKEPIKANSGLSKSTPETPTLDSQDSPNLIASKDKDLHDWDDDSNHQARLVKWVMKERRNQQHERYKLSVRLKNLDHDRKILEREKQNFAAAEDELAQRIYQFQDLLPVAAEFKQLGLDFSSVNSWLICVKEMSQRKGLDIRSAAWKLADDLKAWQELGGFETAISNAKHQLSLLQIASENQKSAMAALVDLRKSGIYEREILQVVKTIRSKNNGHVRNFELDAHSP